MSNKDTRPAESGWIDRKISPEIIGDYLGAFEIGGVYRRIVCTFFRYEDDEGIHEKWFRGSKEDAPDFWMPFPPGPRQTPDTGGEG